jgi:Transposase DDE domain
MPLEDFIIKTYMIVDDFLEKFPTLRSRGPSTHLTDAEVITMEIVGEFLGRGSDKEIYDYFRTHWLSWFPKIGCRTAFTRQLANLWGVKRQFQKEMVHRISPDNDLFLFDGLPIPTCHPKRMRYRNPFYEIGGFGYCAAKDKKYFGFKGHAVVNQQGLILDFTFTPAHIDERDVLPELVTNYKGMLLADKGLIRPDLTELLASQDLNLQTPLRKNMTDPRPKSVVYQMMNVRRLIETTFGQLTYRFNIQSIRAKDLWHLAVKVSRKVLAHTVAFLFAGSLKFDEIL